MKIGLLLWEVVTITAIVFGALCVFWLRNWVSRTDGKVQWGLWLRFSVLLLMMSVVGLVEGVLFSPQDALHVRAERMRRFGISLFVPPPNSSTAPSANEKAADSRKSGKTRAAKQSGA